MSFLNSSGAEHRFLATLPRAIGRMWATWKSTAKPKRTAWTGKCAWNCPQPKLRASTLKRGVRIDPTASLEGPLYIGRGSRIGPGAYVGPYTVLGPFSQIDARASLKHAILWSGVRVGRGTRLRGSVCGKNVVVEPECEIYEGGDPRR